MQYIRFFSVYIPERFIYSLNKREMKEIKFNEKGQYHGRNGYANAVGLEVKKTSSEKFISFKPINSKGVTDSCIIYVPIENLSEVIEALKELAAGKRAQREENIKRIKDVIITWGSTSCCERERDHSPSMNSLAGGRVCELVEQFHADCVETVVYDDENEVDWNTYKYEELSDEVLDEILEIIDDYEADMLKTEKRCSN